MPSAARLHVWGALVVVLGWAGRLGAPAAFGADKPVDFTRDIRPILSEHCFTCHGPDDKQRKGKYRVDTKDGLFRSSDGKALIVAGKAADSDFYRRLITSDADDRMPPEKTGKKLTEAQAASIRRWIDGGAQWNEHWAFATPRRAAEPEVRDGAWSKNSIDRFVLARLEAEGMRPSAEAGKPELLRRASLDLTGLPPTPEELDAFLADTDTTAYEKVVDRLLASPRYGEHMARSWLDAVRYADTHGYHIDSQRDIWPYRDWVIRAFNANLPFDRFTTEQLAGDLLPDPTVEQRVATGFVRCNMSTGEGGVIEAEYAAKYAFDRVETLGTVYLGATLICARCHSHKYDPYPMNEYYGVYGFFNNLAEPVMDGNKPNPDPFLRLPTAEQTERLAWLKRNLDDARSRVVAPDATLDAGQKAWSEAMHLRLGEQLSLLRPGSAEGRVTEGAVLKPQADGSVAPGTGGERTAVYDTRWRLSAGPLAGVRLEVFAPESADGAADDRFCLSEVEAELLVCRDGKCEPTKLAIARAHAGAEAPGYPAAAAIDGKPETGWSPPTSGGGDARLLVLVLRDVADVPADTELRLRLRQEAPGFRRTLPRFRVTAARHPETVALLFPAKPRPWRQIGPFPVNDAKLALAEKHEAETNTDGSRAYPGVRGEVRWADTGEIEDGKTHTLVHEIHGVHGARYLLRSVTSATDRDAEIELRTEAWYRVWVNGVQVAETTSDTAPEEGPRRFPVRFRAGSNDVLIKVVSVNGGISFLCRIDPGVVQPPPPALAAALLASAAPTGGTAEALRDHYRRGHSESHRKLQDEIAAMQEESTRIDRAIVTTLVAKELEKPRDTYFL
ncbi:MAG: DUF1549 domain-containing protein, partial [Verrucomicrobiales bacterium]|nr:DUF1549 domain-containing protein [Verrucomicrobiales bacterium]